MKPFPDSSAPTLLQGIRRWARMAGWPGVLAGGFSLLTLIGFSLLYRTLPVPQAGMLAIVVSISDILTLVALLGLGAMITRLYASHDRGAYNWFADLMTTAIYALPVLGLGSTGAVLLYGFTLWTGLYIVGLTLVGTLLATAYSMLNARGHYAWSASLIRAPNAALVIPGLAGALGLPYQNLTSVLAFYLFSTLCALAAAILRLRRILPGGAQRISRRERFAALAFMATSVTDLLPEQGLVAVAGRVLPLSQVAAFAAVAVFLRPFRLLRSVLGMILAPDLLRFRRESYVRLFRGFWALGLACGVAAAVLIPPFFTRFYGGRYEEAVAWIPYLALSGALLIGTIPARSDLTVRAPIRFVNRFAVAYALSMSVVLTLSMAGMSRSGAIFLAFAVVALQLAETGVAYLYWAGFRKGEVVSGG